MSSSYQVPFPSSPPTTPPGNRSEWRSRTNLSFSYGPTPDLSTTPAGPPPSSTGSFTPADPPPLSTFGSSRPRGQSLFEPTRGGRSSESRNLTSIERQRRSPKKSPQKSSRSNLIEFTATANGKGQSENPQDSPQRSLGQVSYDGEDYNEDEDEDYVPGSSEEESDDDYYEEDDEDYYREDLEMGETMPRQAAQMDLDEQNQYQELNSSIPYIRMAIAEADDMDLRRDNKCLQQDASINRSLPFNAKAISKGRSPSKVSAIAKDIARQLGTAKLEESDDLIIDTELHIAKTYPEERPPHDVEAKIDAALRVVPEALSKVWGKCYNQNKNQLLEHDNSISIGPGNDGPLFRNAAYVANLLLKLHHPPLVRGKQALVIPQLGSKPTAPEDHHNKGREEAYPKILLEWLEEYHNPFRNALTGLKSYQPNPTAHESFWDIIFSAALRGKISEVIQVLNISDFSYARTARDEAQFTAGYDRSQLDVIDKVIRQVAEILESSPSVQEGDWFVYGPRWLLFRRKITQALSDLSSFAEGEGQSHGRVGTSFEASNFGLSGTSTTLTRFARRAGSRVPWTIYQNVKAFYRLLLGGTAELLSSAQDWLEATIALTVWWDGDDYDSDDIEALSHLQLDRSTNRLGRMVDSDQGIAYRRRLAAAFERVTSDSSDDALQIDPGNSVEVAIASVFESDIESVLALLQTWSLPIASAVAEIASQGRWYESASGIYRSRDIFNENDLMVLNYGNNKLLSEKDSILSLYAKALCSRDKFEHSHLRTSKEGWEVALEVLGRLDDSQIANTKISEILNDLSVESDKRADKIIEICYSFDLASDAIKVAEKYATFVAETSEKYGTAVIYYARAHASKKVKDVLDLLISYCLASSTPYPPTHSLDPHLSNILSRPRESLIWLASFDAKASQILSIQMSGYATLRKFYDLRDQNGAFNPSMRPSACLKGAASALVAVIASAADNIQGGIYDDMRPAVVSIDGLLVLLAEAMVFVDQPARILSLRQTVVLLRAIEDFSLVHSRVREQCIDCLTTTISIARSAIKPPDPKYLMKKSASELTASSGFSIVGSSMLDSVSGKKGDQQTRGWDWRDSLQPGAGEKEILSILRTRIARDVSRAWIDGEEF